MTRITRRSFLAVSSALMLKGSRIPEAPDEGAVYTETGTRRLIRGGSTWSVDDVEVTMRHDAGEQRIRLSAPQSVVLRICFRWQVHPPLTTTYLGDDWERSYGTLGWRTLEPERVLPWYFLAHHGDSIYGCGVKTAPAAMCFWQVDSDGVSLWLDVRNGGRGVNLGERELELASVVVEQYSGVSPFVAAQKFCKRMCPQPSLPARPVYGGNNWYYAYGKSSAKDIRDDSQRVASWTRSTENRPFMVIDDGWSPNATAGPWGHGNERFPDMARLASDMRDIGVQPGLWMRPLFTREEVPASWRLPHREAFTLDPTVPDALRQIQEDVRRAVGWGYSLIKHDFSTYDLFGRWGFRMGSEITDANWSFADRSRTNAEIIGDLYSALRQAAGAAMLLGCNTVGHLSAGLFELQRTGDDTSGRDWDRTRKMGVNTLAFRAPQNGAFFAVDADCVGLTQHIPWKFNRQWLDLLARSGTSCFVSAAPDAVGPEQASALKAAFALASKPQPTAEPLDWMDTTEPEHWRLGGQTAAYDWFGLSELG